MTERQRYITTAAKPTPHEVELLTILAEEAAEVIQAVTKILRFGKDDHHPDSTKINTVSLATEIGEFDHVVTRLIGLGVISHEDIHKGDLRKGDRLKYYLQTDAP